MALAPAVIAWIGVATAAVGTVASISQQRSAARDARRAAEKQDAARGQQAAQQSAEAAQARRQQIREARVKRAQVLQSATNTGSAGSSGEMGALGGMQTQLGNTLGASQANIERSQQIGIFQQQASDFNSAAQTHSNRAGAYGQLASFGMNMFSAANTQMNAKPKANVFNIDYT